MEPIALAGMDRRWDCLSLGEVMLRLDPGEGRIHTARQFAVWEGGGEYNVARGLRRCFGLRTAIATALAENPIGQLVEDLILQGGVDPSLLKWIPYDGVGRTVRNGLNFTERGFGVRGAVGCSDRGNTAISQVKRGDFDWESIFGEGNGSRWFHTGGIFAALSASTAEVAAAYPNLKLIASTLRTAHTASRNAWGAIALYQDEIVHVPQRDIDIYDRVGGGDSFASGLIYGFLAGKPVEWAVQCGVAHGALAMTTPGDTSMATFAEVERAMKGGSARIAR